MQVTALNIKQNRYVLMYPTPAQLHGCGIAWHMTSCLPAHDDAYAALMHAVMCGWTKQGQLGHVLRSLLGVGIDPSMLDSR